MTTASSSGLASGPVPVRRAARSELVRWRRSSVAFAPLLGFTVATLQALFFVAVGIAQGWASVLAWNVIWVTGLALPATGLIVGLVAERDRGARDGGTTWRNVTPLTSSVARLAIVSGAVVLMNILAVIPVLAVGSVVANGPAPVGRTVLTALAISLDTMLSTGTHFIAPCEMALYVFCDWTSARVAAKLSIDCAPVPPDMSLRACMKALSARCWRRIETALDELPVNA